MFIAILARSSNKVIGKDNWLPWEIPSDFKHFKDTTLGGIVAMGSKTFESLGSKPLPNRECVVFSRKKKGVIDGVTFITIEQFLKQYHDKEVYIIGGSEIYDYFMNNDLLDMVILSEVNAVVEGDSFFFHDQKLSEMKVDKEIGPIRKEKDQFEYTIRYYKSTRSK